MSDRKDQDLVRVMLIRTKENRTAIIKEFEKICPTPESFRVMKKLVHDQIDSTVKSVWDFCREMKQKGSMDLDVDNVFGVALEARKKETDTDANSHPRQKDIHNDH